MSDSWYRKHALERHDRDRTFFTGEDLDWTPIINPNAHLAGEVPRNPSSLGTVGFSCDSEEEARQKLAAAVLTPLFVSGRIALETSFAGGPFWYVYYSVSYVNAPENERIDALRTALWVGPTGAPQDNWEQNREDAP